MLFKEQRFAHVLPVRFLIREQDSTLLTHHVRPCLFRPTASRWTSFTTKCLTDQAEERVWSKKNLDNVDFSNLALDPLPLATPIHAL